MVKFYKILFMNSMILGTLIAISSYSWFSMWMGLEINMLSIIPLLTASNNTYSAEAALKYFITQILASSILMFAIIMSLNLKEFIPLNSFMKMSMFMMTAFFIKMGAAPFHVWFPEVMEGLSWNNCFIMLTWQKIAPMVLMGSLVSIPLYLTMIIVFSSLISGTLGLNQISLRKIMAYSSINHISWMLASLLNNQNIWLIYFLIYSITSLNLILIFDYFGSFYLQQFFKLLTNFKTLKMFFIMNFISLGGLPPFLGFFSKWLVINHLILNKVFFMTYFLIVTSLISLFFYLRICFSSITLTSSESLPIANYPTPYMVVILNFLGITGMIVATYLFNFN